MFGCRRLTLAHTLLEGASSPSVCITFCEFACTQNDAESCFFCNKPDAGIFFGRFNSCLAPGVKNLESCGSYGDKLQLSPVGHPDFYSNAFTRKTREGLKIRRSVNERLIIRQACFGFF